MAHCHRQGNHLGLVLRDCRDLRYLSRPRLPVPCFLRLGVVSIATLLETLHHVGIPLYPVIPYHGINYLEQELDIYFALLL